MERQTMNYVTPNMVIIEIANRYDILAGSPYDDGGMDEGGEV